MSLPAEEKAQIVAETLVPGGRVSEVARLTQDEVERIRLWKFRTPRSSTRWCSVTRSHEARFRACQAKRSREKDRGCVTM